MSADNSPPLPAGLCAWQPIATSESANTRNRKGFTTVSTIPSIISRRTGLAAPAAALKQTLRPSQISCRPDIDEREIKPVDVFISHRTEFILAVFDAQSAAIPVVRGLQSAVLDFH